DDGRAVCLDWRAHAFGACRRSQLRARAGRMIPAAIDLRRYESLPSTMDEASALASAGAAHGVVVIAEEQTAGRGRRGTHWASPIGAGLYLSFIARPASASLPLI